MWAIGIVKKISQESLLSNVSNDLLPFMVIQSHDNFKLLCQVCDVITNPKQTPTCVGDVLFFLAEALYLFLFVYLLSDFSKTRPHISISYFPFNTFLCP
jgi:hypothetical protein